MKTDAEFWNRAAEKYAAKPVSNVAAFERKKEIMRALLAPDQTLFEHGCGTSTPSAGATTGSSRSETGGSASSRDTRPRSSSSSVGSTTVTPTRGPGSGSPS